MNRDQKYQLLDKAIEDGLGDGRVDEAFISGIDAMIALNLPVKFHRWLKEWPFGFKRNAEYQAIIAIHPHPTDEQLYQYWLDNIYKLEL